MNTFKSKILDALFWSLFFSAGILQSATLKWDANRESDLAGYKVYLGVESGNYFETFDVGNQTYWEFNFYSGTYYFVVTAYDFSGNESGLSREVVYIITSVGQEEKQNVAFQVSPNPFYNDVKIQAFGVVKIYNILGEKIETQEVFGNWFIRMDRHPPGFYFFVYTDEMQVDHIIKRTKL